MNGTQQNPQPDLERLLERGFRYAVALTHDDVQAEDLVQEACARMVRKKQPWNDAYFFTTIRNHFIELYRRKRKFPLLALDENNKRYIFIISVSHLLFHLLWFRIYLGIYPLMPCFR